MIYSTNEGYRLSGDTLLDPTVLIEPIARITKDRMAAYNGPARTERFVSQEAAAIELRIFMGEESLTPEEAQLIISQPEGEA